MTTRSATASLTLLIDSNVLIAVQEHVGSDHVHGPPAAQLHRLSSELRHRIVVSHGTKSDLFRATGQRRQQGLRALDTYLVLPAIPTHPAIAAEFPTCPGENDRTDIEVASALASGAAHWLITEDTKLRRRVRRAGFENVFSLTEAVEALQSQLPTPVALPSLTTVRGYEIDLSASIFDGLRADYDGFDLWWRTKVCAEDRDVLLLGEPHDPQGICVLKMERDNDHGLGGAVLKLCTFKVGDEFRGVARGELLLQGALEQARRSGVSRVYLEALGDKSDLLLWLEQFGFHQHNDARTARGEFVMTKVLAPEYDIEVTDPLHHAIAFGPGHVLPHRPVVAPVEPRWHQRLFPQAHDQGDLFTGLDACGNAIRKVYLCRSPARYLQRGDTILFCQTGTGATDVTAVGVVESTLVTAHDTTMLAFAGSRSVYSADQIRRWCTVDTLGIRFRLDRVLHEPWPLGELIQAGLLLASPQSITRLRNGAEQWISAKLAAQS